MSFAIRVDNLGKRYRLGATHAGSVRELVNRTWKRVLGRKEELLPHEHAELQALVNGQVEKDGSFWALREVSFEVRPGEVVGIIGRNGSGKSTLLKILSQITAPTLGRVELHGRVASLLEVGTGFHPELSGRENVFLNGAILGMTKTEIRKKFDEIVAFAEIEKFIDTPVKRYSSGMYVRLAFAIAAHLEPEILVVDEVLAVGDQQFQNKCVRQMEGVAQQGRTVLVVSHNLSTVQNLCNRVIQLNAGSLMGDGPAKEQVGLYMKQFARAATQPLYDRTDREGDGRVRLTRVSLVDQHGNPAKCIHAGDSLEIRLQYISRQEGSRPEAAISVWSSDGVKVFHVDNVMRCAILPRVGAEGTYSCFIPRVNLVAGKYYVNALIKTDGIVADHVNWVADFEVTDGDFYKTGGIAIASGGFILLDHEWR